MRIGSLFSGAAGLDRAVEAVFGAEVAWFAEIDKAASKVLAYHYPDVPNLGDITQVDWADIPPVDILCGGFPCQDVSAAGKRAGIRDGTRSGLWSVFAEAIDALRPQIVVIENVRGLLSALAHRAGQEDFIDDEEAYRGGDDSGVEPAADVVGDGSARPVLRALGAVLGDLSDLGYDAQWATVAAADIGAPHRRERVFIVASATDADNVRLQADQFAVGRQPSLSGSRAGFSSLSCDVADSPGNGWDEGRPEPARQQRGFDVAVRGDGHGVDLLPTPGKSDGDRGPCAESGGTRPSGQPRQKNLNTVTVRELGVQRGLELVDVGVGEEDGAVPVLPADGGGHDAVVVAGDGEGVAVDVGGGVNGHNACLPVELAGTKQEPALLPTPRSSDCFGAGQHGDGGMDLRTTVSLLPTPKAHDGEFGTPRTSGRPIEKSTHLGTIASLEQTSHWGKYEPAIRRWEQVTRPAPAPTEPNKNGNPRLSAAFSEWLMGWPAGWVTDPAIGISRNDQLRIIGNGVVSIQAAAALRYLLAVTA